MDYYNFDPTITDSLLDFEISVSKTSFGSYRDRNWYPELADDRRLVRDCFDLDTLYERSAIRLEQSNSSIYFKKSKDLEVTEKHTELTFENSNKNKPLYYQRDPKGFENLNKNKPLYQRDPKDTQHKEKSAPRLSKQSTRIRPIIRVTVIPINTAHNKRRKQPSKNKKLQTTVSNKETCIKATNVYLVFGQGQDKVHEVRSASSELPTSLKLHRKNEDLFLEHSLSNLRKYLDMEGKKKKKGKKEKEQKNEENFSLMDVFEACDSPKLSLLKECMCPGENENVNPRRSRVRISGKIGLTEDDRYVLKCNATIDGKPVETKPLEQPRHSQSPTRCPARRCPEPEETYNKNNKCPGDGSCYRERQRNVISKEAFAQANITFEEPRTVTCPAYTTICPAFIKTCPAISKPAQRSEETQCDPMSFKTGAVCISNIEKLKIESSTRDEYMQCNCISEKRPANIGIGTDKSINSPLVIISVYPKSSEMAEDKNDSLEQLEIPVEKVPKQKVAKKGKKKEGGARSRSASPAKSPSKNRAETTPKGRKEKSGTDNKSTKVKKGAKKEKSAKGTMKEKSRSPSPDKQSLQSGQKSPPIGKVGVAGGRCTECCMGCTGMSGQVHKAEQTRSRQQTKRMMNWVSAKDEESNVAININGENEFYDVVFKQGGMSTDVRVRKTKHKGKTPARLDNNDNSLSDSLENFLLLSEGRKERRRSFSQTFLHENELRIDGRDTNDVNEEQTPAPLKVRDSIEISHRREEKTSVGSMKHSDSSASSKLHFEIAAETSVRHYRGDNCDVDNPVQRDKEIRELLGIEKPRPSRMSQVPRIYFKENVDVLHSSQISHKINGNHKNNRKTNTINASTSTDFLKNVTQQTSGHLTENNSSCIGTVDSLEMERAYAAYNYEKGLNKLSMVNNISSQNTIDNMLNTTSTGTSNANCVVIFDTEPNSHKTEKPSKNDPSQKTDLNVIPQPINVKQIGAVKNFNSWCSTSLHSQQINKGGDLRHPVVEDNQQTNSRPTTEYTWLPWQPTSDNHRVSVPHLHSIRKPQPQKPVSRVQDNETEIILQEKRNPKKDNEFQVRQIVEQNQNFVPANSRYIHTTQQHNVTCFIAMSADQQNGPQYKQNVLCQSKSDQFKENHSLLRGFEKLRLSYGDSFSNQQQLTSDNYSYGNPIFTKDIIKQHITKHIPEISVQLEQLANNKHITITRKQYTRMKKVLESSNLKKKSSITKKSSAIMGEIRFKRTPKIPPVTASKENQFEKRTSKIKSESLRKPQSKELTEQFKSLKTAGEKSKCQGKEDTQIPSSAKREKKSKTSDTPCYVSYFNVKNNVSAKELTTELVPSLTIMCRTDVEFKHTSYSTIDGRHSERKSTLLNKLMKSSSSVHTVFKGCRNMNSPNLGTSAYSLRSVCTDGNSKCQWEVEDSDQRSRKPFLRRLMSCLVMRSKVEVGGDKARQMISDKRRKPASVNSSTDWYHISTSLGAMEVTSSLYDTSNSFYSNHSIHPLNSKIKSGFLKSFRMKLANRHN